MAKGLKETADWLLQVHGPTVPQCQEGDMLRAQTCLRRDPGKALSVAIILHPQYGLWGYTSFCPPDHHPCLMLSITLQQ